MFIGGIIVYAENSREWTKENLQELLHKYNKIVGYYYTEKSIAFLYTSNGQLEFETKKHIILYINSSPPQLM